MSGVRFGPCTAATRLIMASGEVPLPLLRAALANRQQPVALRVGRGLREFNPQFAHRTHILSQRRHFHATSGDRDRAAPLSFAIALSCTRKSEVGSDHARARPPNLIRNISQMHFGQYYLQCICHTAAAAAPSPLKRSTEGCTCHGQQTVGKYLWTAKSILGVWQMNFSACSAHHAPPSFAPQRATLLIRPV